MSGKKDYPENLRPESKLSLYERKKAIEMRKKGSSFQEISSILKKDISDVEKSLSTMRYKRKNPSRYTLNVQPSAYKKIDSMRKNNEPIWKTINRLLDLAEDEK
ncbi:hypothetical protein [Bombella apis]|uniref:Helix-turn-helix domain-containing protein n=1 Tax=Bombella apis TaxID=1785988 RepID=A0ABR9MRT2_9PROT|nr:hypothetical protein [Bombella apis]MBE1724581.1 hypothetical protein [Bombella apis]